MPRKPRKPHVGVSVNRLSAQADNPREVAFALQWEDENKRSNILDHLLYDGYADLPRYSLRDAQVAATVVQWLGSNVGMSFICAAAKRERRISEFLLASLSPKCG